MGQFRDDLFHRISLVELHLPPLRDRNGDLPLLAQHFLKQLGFADYGLKEVTLILKKCGCGLHHWSGNVRELAGVLKQAVILAPARNVPSLLGSLTDVMARLPKTAPADPDLQKMLETLERNGGNKSAAARELDVPLTTLCNRLKRYGRS